MVHMSPAGLQQQVATKSNRTFTKTIKPIKQVWEIRYLVYIVISLVDSVGVGNNNG